MVKKDLYPADCLLSAKQGKVFFGDVIYSVS